MANKRWSIDVAPEIKIVGQNFESADLVNPNGYEFGERFYLRATASDGSRRRHYRLFVTSEEAERYLACAAPVYTDAWRDDHPAYGSPAYTREEPEIAEQERQEELERERWSLERKKWGF